MDITDMDVSDLRKCTLCGEGMMHDDQIFFYEIRVSQCVVDVRSIQQIHAMEQLMGGAVGLARVLAPSNTVAKRLPETRHLVCSTCALVNPAIMACAAEPTKDE